MRSEQKIFVLKIKGIAKIPSYVQVRNSEFALIAYFRLDRIDEALERKELKNININKNFFSRELEKLEFGVIKKLSLNKHDNCS